MIRVKMGFPFFADRDVRAVTAMLPSFVTRWLLAALLLGLLVSARLPAGAAKAVGKWPREALDFLIMPVADPLKSVSARIPGIAPQIPVAGDDIAALREHLAWARRQNELLKAQLRDEHEANRWFAQIQPFVNFAEVSPVPVGVATWSGDYKHPTLTLSGGGDSGVRARQIVVGAAAELVGVVDDSVTPFSSRVRALLWPGTAMDCRVVSPLREGDGVKVRLKADADGLAFEGDIEREVNVSVGDEVILDDTSFGGHARGFVVGRITELRDPHPDPNRNLFYKQVVVRGASDLARLSRVIVLVPKQEKAK